MSVLTATADLYGTDATAQPPEDARVDIPAVPAKSDFLANMSDEIRTPLTAILGYTEMLLDECRDSTQVEWLRIIRRNGAHLLQVLDGVLDRSRSEAGRMTTNCVFCSPVPIVNHQIVNESEPPMSPAFDPAVPTPFRVLLVEDGIDNQRLLSLLLKRSGAAVTLAMNGREACDEVESKLGCPDQFDLVLMDIQMPVMDGHEATRALRHMGFNRPIVAVTVHSLPGDREKCLASGCDDYLTKPIAAADFKRHITKWMSAARPASVS